ncbi:hypothetical protein ACG0Z6_13055 [Roseateles sp. BYS180W]|uniref:Uncharacterized protein n=1 Tax=Roseateles rivi TaxID=3299028 RepID=A0ABW7FXX0_9BURK
MVWKRLKRWWRLRTNAARWAEFSAWAQGQGGSMRLFPDGRGFALDFPSHVGGALRIEWGGSTRRYVVGQELRIRHQCGLDPELQLMVIERTLMEALEREVFEAYTDTVKTRSDTDTPEEMRWLVMFQKLGGDVARLARQHFGVLGLRRELCTAWMDPPFEEALHYAVQDLKLTGRPLVLMCMRSAVVLRIQMPVPDLHAIEHLVRLVQRAGRSAHSIYLTHDPVLGDSLWRSTAATAWTPEGNSPA